MRSIGNTTGNEHQTVMSGFKNGINLNDIDTSNPLRMTSDQDKKTFFQEAITRLMDRMYGAAMRFTRDPNDAEDLLSETMEKAWRSLGSLDDLDKFDGWIMRILSNTYISQWRRQKTHDRIFDNETQVDDIDDTHSLYAKLHQPFLLWWGTPETTFLNNLLREDIEKALDSLSDNYRVVVVMIQVLGFSYEEAANDLGVPVGTVRSRLNRGRQQLQVVLWQNAEDANLNLNSD
jgi:RNA polymerase sigma factor (sigma-70 family)